LNEFKPFKCGSLQFLKQANNGSVIDTALDVGSEDCEFKDVGIVTSNVPNVLIFKYSDIICTKHTLHQLRTYKKENKCLNTKKVFKLEPSGGQNSNLY
jgi:hypothetical protein